MQPSRASGGVRPCGPSWTHPTKPPGRGWRWLTPTGPPGTRGERRWSTGPPWRPLTGWARPRDARLATEALGQEAAPRPAPKQVNRTFMFTDIVRSTNLVEALGDEAWGHLIRWHDEQLRSQFAAHRGEVVKAIGDGFFVAFQSASEAVECAVAIQRVLHEHRRTHGFAPQVRIGVHAASATHERLDYRGKGVNAAARIGALANGDEILATAETALGYSSTGHRPPLRYPQGLCQHGRGRLDPMELTSAAGPFQ
jgi:class 3 adenylate cyclase